MAEYEGFFASEGLELLGAGAERHAHCPFHEDRQPSLSVNVESGLWRCHACGEQGDVYTFYEKRHNCDFKRAKEAVDRFLGIVSPGPHKPAKKPKAPEPPPISEEEVDKLHQELLAAERPMAFLRDKRGLTEETIKAYKLGYDGQRITIPVRDEKGRVRNLRRYHPTKRPKMLPYKEGYGATRLYPIEALESEELVLCEGELDCLISRQHGLPAITQTGGAGTWQAEWTAHFKGKKVWICYDYDMAGAKGAEHVAQALAPVAAEVRIVDLPVEEPGEDLTDWFMKYGGTLEHWQELAEAAEVYQPEEEKELSIEEIVDSLPPDVDFSEKQKALKEIYKRIARITSPSQRDHYIQLIKARFKLSVGVIREEVRLAEMAAKAEPPMPTPLPEPRDHGWSIVQDFRGDVFHYGIWLPTSSGEYVLRLITSERRLEDPPPLTGDHLPKDTARWSVDSATPYNAFAYLAGKAQVAAEELFWDLQRFFRRYMWYPDERTYELLAAWTMQTYVFMVFDQVPYLALVGTKRSGKTRLFEILEMLAFNARLSSSISDSYIFRSIQLDRTTLLVDEADSLRQPAKDGTNERLEILRSGYRRSGSVGRIEGEDRQRVDFSTYSMKAIANVTGIEEALEDRTISIPVERKPKGVKLERLVQRNLQRTTQILRNRLYCFGLQYASKLAELYETVEIAGVEDREAEIWSGLLCIADLVGGDVRDHFEELAREGQERKSLHEGAESVDAQIIMAVWTVVKETEPVRVDTLGRWFSSKVLRQAVMDQLDWDNFSYQRLANDLIKLRVIHDSAMFKQRLRLEFNVTDEKGVSRKKKQQVMCYRLDEERVIASAERYSIPLTGTVSEEDDDDDEAPF